MSLSLNARSRDLLAAHETELERLRVRSLPVEGGGRVLDFGIEAPGGLEAGLLLARLCLADLGQVSLVPSPRADVPHPHVQVFTDHPLPATLGSQYAGWEVKTENYFAMGSGPFRARRGTEKIFELLGGREATDVAVGILESRQLPGPEVLGWLSEKLDLPASSITLSVAPTASQAGGLQVVARSVETALHRLESLDFDLERVESGLGTCPLPPVASGDLAAIGRTNDCVLYGADVTLWVRGDDSSLEEIAPRVPSTASPEHGAPFAEIFARHDHDFYAIDPALFSPARVTFQNLDTGRSHVAGRIEPDVLARSLVS